MATVPSTMVPCAQAPPSLHSLSGASLRSPWQKLARLQEPTHVQGQLALLCGASASRAGEGGLGSVGTRPKRGAMPGVVSVRAIGRDPNDFGARNPRPDELESNFGDKTLGNWDTEHKIKLPSKIREVNGLARLSCEPLPEGASPLALDECKALLRKVVGWKIVDEAGSLRLRGEWKVRSYPSGVQLFQRIADVAEVAGHHPDLHLVAAQTTNATVDIWSHSVGGLTDNDFILAAKIDLLNMNDLISKKNRAWA